MKGFCKTVQVVCTIWLFACQAEEITIAENPDADAKTVLTNYAKHFFRGADINLTINEDQDPPRYRLKVEQFRLTWSSNSLRTTFPNDVSTIMKRISKHPSIKKYEGSNQFFAYVETEDIRGVTDTSKAMSIILPNDLNVNWQSMMMDSEKFLRYLHHETTNFTSGVYVNWYLPQLKPEYWK